MRKPDRFLEKQARMPLAKRLDLIDFDAVYVGGQVEQAPTRLKKTLIIQLVAKGLGRWI